MGQKEEKRVKKTLSISRRLNTLPLHSVAGGFISSHQMVFVPREFSHFPSHLVLHKMI